MIFSINLGWRANILRISVSWSIVLFYYLYLLKPRLLNLITPLIFITPLAVFYDPIFAATFTNESIVAIIIQGVFGTAIANILFFNIIEIVNF